MRAVQSVGDWADWWGVSWVDLRAGSKAAPRVFPWAAQWVGQRVEQRALLWVDHWVAWKAHQ